MEWIRKYFLLLKFLGSLFIIGVFLPWLCHSIYKSSIWAWSFLLGKVLYIFNFVNEYMGYWANSSWVSFGNLCLWNNCVQDSGSFLTYMHLPKPCWILKGPSVSLQHCLSVQLSSLVLYPMDANHFCYFGLSVPSQLRELTELCLYSCSLPYWWGFGI